MVRHCEVEACWSCLVVHTRGTTLRQEGDGRAKQACAGGQARPVLDTNLIVNNIFFTKMATVEVNKTPIFRAIHRLENLYFCHSVGPTTSSGQMYQLWLYSWYSPICQNLCLKLTTITAILDLCNYVEMDLITPFQNVGEFIMYLAK